jgi:hypothetical protein
MRWPIALAVAALIVATATLHLRVTPVTPPPPPVAALLYPYGDVSGDPLAQIKTLNVSGRYATVAAFGRVVLSTNTSGWHVLVSKYVLPPLGASREVGEYITVPLDNGAFLELWSYNNESGVAALLRGGIRYVWATKILKVGDYYVWYPTTPTPDTYDFIARVARPPVYVLVPRRDYVSFNNRTICFYADYFSGTYNAWGEPIWTKKGVCFAYETYVDFKQLDPNTGYIADGLEWRGGVFVYWPVVAAYWGGEATYLRAEGRR